MHCSVCDFFLFRSSFFCACAILGLQQSLSLSLKCCYLFFSIQLFSVFFLSFNVVFIHITFLFKFYFSFSFVLFSYFNFFALIIFFRLLLPIFLAQLSSIFLLSFLSNPVISFSFSTLYFLFLFLFKNSSFFSLFSCQLFHLRSLIFRLFFTDIFIFLPL